MDRGAVSFSSFTCIWTYSVFLNFRGRDTRTCFVEFLFHSLRVRGIHTFIDDKGLNRGEKIVPALFKAIEESRIAIVVFSKNYASSDDCLDELVHIMKYKGKDRWVLPVFYHVDPSEVGKQTNSFEEEFAKLEEKFPHEKVQKWREALCEAAKISGFHFKSGSPSELVERIVEEVSKKINPTLLHVSHHPIGLESPVKDVIASLQLNYEGVKMVGIGGMGGSGKSTIARAVHNLIGDQFDASCFLPIKNDLVKLQKALVSELLGVNNMKFSDASKGISILKMMLRRKKVLLILDNVDNRRQLNALAGGQDWFGPGSRVVIITGDKHLLAQHGVVELIEVKELDGREALELFSWKAFNNNEVDPNYADLSNRALHYTGGLPLALEVVGSFLFGKSRDEWNSALDKFEKCPPLDLYRNLKVRYDSLDRESQQIFLDIACFFNGADKKYVMEVLHACDLHPEVGIRELTDKFLVKVDASNRVRMHELIQDMGREIVRRESNEPGEHSRLWCEEDIIHVLEENTGTGKIEVLCLRNDKEVQCSGTAFKQMKNLRVLIIENARFSTSPKHLPNSLRVLEWSGYPSPSLPSDFHPKKLVKHSLPESCLKF